jgi:two-component system, NtrC family, response regulator AtoC
VSRNVLIVDDDRAMCELMAAGLEVRGFAPTFRLAAEEAFALVTTGEFDAVMADINMPGQSGLELCKRIAGARPDIPVIVVTAFGSLETAVAAIRAGAYDFITKPFDVEELALTLERGIQHRELQQEVTRLRRVVAESHRFDDFLGESALIKRVFERIEAVAASDVTVLITGETGTGKELAARALHNRSNRSEGPFVAVNCAAMAESLLESELFGHVKGAFTDAKEARPGLLAKARRGTIFLDEIGDMPIGMQAKLLRALEARIIRPVGSDTEIPIDVRVIAATNRDLESDVEERRFRRDLYFRINVIRLELPPLRSRGNDVLLLAQHFLEGAARRFGKQVTGLASSAAERLLAYPWPGNVRELQNAIEHSVTITAYDRMVSEDLPERIRDYRRSHVLVVSDNPAEFLPMHEVERRYILRVLEAAGGNKTLAARLLGFDRRTMYRKLERFAADQVSDERQRAG